MFSSGWMWLVTDEHGHLGIVPTFGAGTLLVRSSRASPALEEWIRAVGEPSLQELTPHGQVPAFAPAPEPPRASSPLSGAPLGGVPPVDPHAHTRSMATYHPIPRGTREAPPMEVNDTRIDPKKIGKTLFPLLCVSVHEHAWVSAGYGVWGKEEYMKRFWSVVDWANVADIFNKVAKDLPSSA